MTPNGSKGATTDKAALREFWAQDPDANVGVVPAEGLFVLDVDPRNGGSDSLEALLDEVGGWETLHYKTGGGGLHYWFRTTEAVPTRVNILPGIDIKSSKGYVVVPPSRHVAGDYEQISFGPIAAVPTELLRILGAAPGSAEVSVVADRRIDWDLDLVEGGRNSGLATFAGAMRRHGAGYETVYPALISENEARCVPPLESREVAAIAKSICSYAPAEAEGLAAFFGAPEDVDPAFVEVWRVLHGMRRGTPLPHPDKLEQLLHLVPRIRDSKHRLYAERVIVGRIKRELPAHEAEGLIRLLSPSDGREPIGTNGEGQPVLRILRAEDVHWDTETLVEGRIPTASVGAVVSNFSMGKTWLMVDLGLSVAFGRPWLGAETREAPVMFCVAEGQREFQKRLYSWLVAHGVLRAGATAEDLFAVLDGRVFINAKPVQFDHPHYEEALTQTIRDQKIELVIVDTYGKSLGRDQSEDSNDVANEVTGMFSRVTAQTNSSIVLTHHTGHSTDSRSRGASGFEQGLDFVYVVKGSKDQLSKGSALTLCCSKMRDGKRPNDVGYRLRTVSGLSLTDAHGTEHEFESAVIETSALERPLSLEAVVFKAIQDAPGATKADLYAQIGRRKVDVDAAVSGLIKRGAVSNESTGRIYDLHASADYRVGPEGEVESLVAPFVTEEAAS